MQRQVLKLTVYTHLALLTAANAPHQAKLLQFSQFGEHRRVLSALEWLSRYRYKIVFSTQSVLPSL